MYHFTLVCNVDTNLSTNTLPNHYIQMEFLAVHFGHPINFYQNISEICVFCSNEVFGTAIHSILHAKHLIKICQLGQKLK